MSFPVTGFLLNEDRALKSKLEGLTVRDLKNAARPVKVWFRDPQKEQRDTEYPFITIHFSGVTRDRTREHSGFVRPTYIPDGVVLDELSDTRGVLNFHPVPVDLSYAVVTHCRNPMHDRMLQFALLGVDYLPYRYGYLNVDEDNTIRRLDLLDVQSSDVYDQNGKIVFRKIYHIQVSSEIFPTEVAQTRVADEVELTMTPIDLEL